MIPEVGTMHSMFLEDVKVAVTDLVPKTQDKGTESE